MIDKSQPIGVCDHCLGPIPPGQWYTRRGPRLYCGVDCRNTANARAGAPIISQKNRGRIEAGTWQNPAKLRPPTPDEQSRRARRGRLHEVNAGTWRNPALTPEARKKLSRPRKHDGVLHLAIEKLSAGLSMSELTADEAIAYRRYRSELRKLRREAINAQARLAYHRRMDQLKSVE